MQQMLHHYIVKDIKIVSLIIVLYMHKILLYKKIVEKFAYDSNIFVKINSEECLRLRLKIFGDYSQERKKLKFFY